MKCTIDEKQAKRLLNKYKPYLSKKDLGKVFSLALEQPKKDIDTIAEHVIMKKYAIHQLTDLIEKSGGDIDFKKIMKKLNLSKSGFYFRLNYLKRYYFTQRVNAVIKKGKIVKSKRAEKRHVNKLLKNKDGTRYVLMNPGPVMTTTKVKNALIQHDLCHRDKDFSDLLARLKKKSLKIFRADSNYRAIFVSGSGTSGLESALSSVIPPGMKVLVLANGAFGERLHEILELHGISQTYIHYKWGELIKLDDVKKALKDPKIGAIAMNHHETSVGLLNPIREVGKLAKAGKKLFIVDAISSLGAETLSMKADNIDVAITSSNKCLHSITGISIICIKHDLIKSMKNQKPRSFYLDLYRHYKYLENLNQTPFTPNVTSFYPLEAAIDELLEMGLEGRRKEYIRRNAYLKTELGKRGFEPYTNYGNESHSIMTLRVPDDIDYPTFYNEVKKFGFLIYNCKPPMDKKYFQLANMGHLNDAMLHDFIYVVDRVLKKMRK